MKRYYMLDAVRGGTLVSMIFYHAVWDLVHIFHVNWDWYVLKPGYLWQQSICCVFILISGFCFSLGKKKWRRSFQILAGGILISVVTILFVPESKVLFGILIFLGVSSISMIILEPLLQHISPAAGILGNGFLFLAAKHVNQGYLGFKKVYYMNLPQKWYSNLFTAFLGFPPKNFYSADYFSFLPWIFLYFVGYYVYHFLKKKNKLEILTRRLAAPLEWMGQHSLIIYLFHQPVIYGLLFIYFQKINLLN